MQAAFETKRMDAVEKLFEAGDELRGIKAAGLHGMGRVWMDAPMKPNGAVMTCGDFLICAGTPGASARHLLRVAMQSERREWVARCPEQWMDALRDIAQVDVEKRIAFAHHVQPRDTQLRTILASQCEKLTFMPIAGEWIDFCRQKAWARDFVSCFADDADYEQNGLGLLAMHGGEVVAGASSYVSYPNGIEVQVQTRDDCCGRGYATKVAAALVLLAHERGLCATWDAANPASARIARNLGYQCLGEYEVAMIKMRKNVG